MWPIYRLVEFVFNLIPDGVVRSRKSVEFVNTYKYTSKLHDRKTQINNNE